MKNRLFLRALFIAADVAEKECFTPAFTPPASWPWLAMQRASGSRPPEKLHEMAGIGAASFPRDHTGMSDAMSITNRYFTSLYEAVKNQVTLLDFLPHCSASR